MKSHSTDRIHSFLPADSREWRAHTHSHFPRWHFGGERNEARRTGRSPRGKNNNGRPPHHACHPISGKSGYCPMLGLVVSWPSPRTQERGGGRGKRKRPIRHPSVPPPVMELLHPLCGAAPRPHCCACLSKHKHTQPLSYGSRVDGWFADLQQLEVALVPRRSRGPLSRPSLISHPTQHFNTIWPPHAQFSTLQWAKALSYRMV